MTLSAPQTMTEDKFDIKLYFQTKNYHIPSSNDKIYKEECMYCFKTPLEQGKSNKIVALISFF